MVCVWLGAVWVERGCVDERIGFGLYQSSGVRMAGMPKNGKSGLHCWGRGSSTQFAQQLVSTVTAQPLVGCVVWSHCNAFLTVIYRFDETMNF